MTDELLGSWADGPPSVVIDSSALFCHTAFDEDGWKSRLDRTGWRELLTEGVPHFFAATSVESFRIAVVGQAAFNGKLVATVGAFIAAEPGFLFTGGMLHVSRFYTGRADFLIHGNSFDSDHAYRGPVGEQILFGDGNHGTWRSVAEHIMRVR